MPKPLNRPTQKLVKEWLKKAEADIRLAEYLLAENAPFWEAIAFHCQQSAEKYLKAFLVQHQIEFPKTHDLEKLLELMAKADKKTSTRLLFAKELTPFGVLVRYPDDALRVDRKKAETALSLAQKVEKGIRPKLKNK